MRRARSITAYLIIAVLLSFFVCGCSIKAPEPGHAKHAQRPPDTIDEDPSRASIRHALVLISKRTDVNGCSMLYPYVSNQGMTILNMNIRAAFDDFAADCEADGGEIGYETEFNRYGLISFLITWHSDSGRLLNMTTASFDSDTGRRIFISDCFGAASQDHTERLYSAVTDYVEKNGLALTGVQPPVNDGTLFLLTSGGLDLLYREYELCTSDAGCPRIKISIESVKDSIAADGLLNRLK